MKEIPYQVQLSNQKAEERDHSIKMQYTQQNKNSTLWRKRFHFVGHVTYHESSADRKNSSKNNKLKHKLIKTRELTSVYQLVSVTSSTTQMNQDTKQRQQPLVISAETYPMKAIKQTETPTPKANHTNLQQQEQKSTSVGNH